MEEYIDDEPIDTIPAGFTWRGQELHKFSMMRQAIWHQLRRGMWPTERVQDVAEYLGGAVLLVWLCTLDDNQIEAKLARRNNMAMFFEAMAWAEESVGKGRQRDIIRLALDMFDDAHAEAFDAVDSGSTEGTGGGKPSAAHGGAS